MRHLGSLLALSLALAAPVFAQATPPDSAVATPAEALAPVHRGSSAVMTAAGIGAAVVTVWIAIELNGAGDGPFPAIAALSSPLVSGATVYAVGRAYGGQGRLGPSLGNAAFGALPGIALTTAGVLIALPSTFGGEHRAVTEAGALLAFAGIGLFYVFPSMSAVRAFRRSEARADAVILRTMEGAMVPGAALSVRF